MITTTKLAGSLIMMLLGLMLLAVKPVQGQTIPLKPCLEHFTSSSCPPCAAFGPAFRNTLSGYEGRYTVIRYQMYWPGSGDPYYFADSKKRRDYYTITGVPGLACNGAVQLPYAQSFSKAKMDSLLTELTGVQIAISSSVNLDKIVTATITITPEISYPAGLVAQIAVMEGVTTQNATTNGEKAFDHVTMGFLPDASGTILPALVAGQPVSLTYSLDMKTTHMETANDLSVAAFIQNNSTKKVIQSNNAPVTHQFTDYQVVLNVIDNDYNTVPGGRVFIPYYGETEFGSNGLANYSGVFPGVLDFNVTAPGYEGTNGELTVTASDVSLDVMVEKPDIFYFEDFGWNTLPQGWSAETTNGFYLVGAGSESGSIVFYKPNEGADNNYLIMPAINLNQSGIFSFRAGVQSGSPELRVGIATLEMKPGLNGSEAVTITGFAELYSAKINNTDDYSIFGFQLPEPLGNQRIAFRYVGATGSYCELDQVAVLEDIPGVKVQFLVTDQNDVPLKNTSVTMNEIVVENNAYGLATFRDTDPGNYSYSVTYKGDEIATGILNVDDALVKEIKHNTSGIEGIPSEVPVSIYPNPVKDHFTVNGIQTGVISIMTLNGQQLMQRKISNGESVSTEGLAKGVYLVSIQSGTTLIYRKLMISK